MRIAILGDFPIGNVFKQYSYRAHFYPSWLYCLYEALATESEFDVHWIVINKSIKTKEILVAGNQTFHVLPGCRQMIGLVTAYLHDRYAVYTCLKQIKPDIFHAWGTERFYGLAAKDYKKGKTLLSVQGLLKSYMKREDFPNLPGNIIPHGAVDRPGMAALLGKAWCLVHPSLADTGPTILKEARVAGVAAVVTSECGAKQYIQQGKSGFIIPPHDVQALVDAVLQVTKSRKIAAQMGTY